jgi:hypothetical protein
MTKRKHDKIEGHDPWRVEVAGLIERRIDPDVAWATVAIRWMRRGELRLLASFPVLDGAVLDELRKMILSDQLTVKRRRGAPKQPSKSVRDLAIAALYETRKGKAADAIQALAEQFGISDELVRQAIKRRPK